MKERNTEENQLKFVRVKKKSYRYIHCCDLKKIKQLYNYHVSYVSLHCQKVVLFNLKKKGDVCHLQTCLNA